MIAGTQIGTYRVVQQICEGGMGAVWLAEHTMLGRRAEIKVLHPSKLVGDQSMKTQTTAVMGTPTYMSPERCRGAGQVITGPTSMRWAACCFTRYVIADRRSASRSNAGRR